MHFGRVDGQGLWMMATRDERFEQLVAKLESTRIRSTLAFAGLFQVTHEMIKRSVLDEVKGFYGFSNVLGSPTWLLGPDGKAAYESKVLALDPKSSFRASLLWLVNSEAITSAQMHVLDRIYQHRHDLTHELGKYLVDPDFEPDAELFVEAVTIFRSISRFWTQIEIDIGTFEDHGDVTVDDAVPAYVAVLQLCIDAYLDGLPHGRRVARSGDRDGSRDAIAVPDLPADDAAAPVQSPGDPTRYRGA